MKNKEYIYKVFDNFNDLSIYNKGERIYHKNDVTKGIYRVLEGRVKIIKSDCKKQNTVILYLLFANEIFGLVDYFNKFDLHRATAIAMDDNVKVQFIPYSEIEKRIFFSPEKSLLTINILLELYNKIWERYCECRTVGINNKVYELLIKLAAEKGTKTKEGTLIKSIIHQDLADYLGIGRIGLSNSLNEIRREGKIDYNRQTILIKNQKNKRRLKRKK